jgi:hypothetical protein
VLLKLCSNQDLRVRGAVLLTLMDLKKMIVDLIRTIDRVMSKRRHRTVRTDPYSRLFLVNFSLTLPLRSVLLILGAQSSLAFRLKQNFNILDAFLLVESWL